MLTRKFKDTIASKAMLIFCLFILSLTFLMAFGLYQRSKPILAITGLRQLFFSGAWHPGKGQYWFSQFYCRHLLGNFYRYGYSRTLKHFNGYISL